MNLFAVEQALVDFNEALKTNDDTIMDVYIHGERQSIGSEASRELLIDIKTLIVKDEDTICYIDCAAIDSIVIN